ncbi:MAG: hypothetical protein JWR50_2397 [Mucilaginibacter sp.]|nr:hypothetical protein [Mucilaginibacter sp.]
MKLIRIFIAVLLVTGVAQTYARPNSGNVTEDRHLSGFHAVDVSGSFDVYITQGNTESVKVDAPADVIHNILTEVNGGTLSISTKSHFTWRSMFNNKKMVIYVTIKNVNRIALTGSGDVFFKDGINANSLSLELTGSGDLYGKVNAKGLESTLTGSGDVKISGHANNQKIEVTGSGDYSAHGLTTTNTSVSVGGSGDASVNVSGNLKASVTGSGDIHYSGSPKYVSKSKSGSGDISGN